MPRPRGFQPRDLLRQILVSHPVVASDGDQVAYTRRTVERGEYRFRIWAVPWRGGRPRQLTAGAVDARPRFSPDGETLLFLSERSGRMQPWTLPLAGGEPTQLAELDGNVTAAEWSPDGRLVLLLAPSGEQRFLVGDPESPVARRIGDLTWRLDMVGVRDQFTSAWVVVRDGGKPRRLTNGSYEVLDAFWHPEGERIGVLADRGEDAGLREQPSVWNLPAAGGRPRHVVALNQLVYRAAWSPAGQLALLGHDGARYEGWGNVTLHVAAPGGPKRLAPGLDRTLFNATAGDVLDLTARLPPPLRWLDNQTLVALVSDEGRSVPYRFALDGSYEPLASGEIVAYALDAAAGCVVVAACVDGEAGEIYAVEDGALRPLTRDGSRWFKPFAREPERVRARHRDGHAVEGFLWRARGRRRGLVLHVHGGPYLAHGPVPWLEMAALADAGFHVLGANPRGSVGYGEAYARAIHGAWGEADESDFLRLADWATRNGLAERRRIGLLGLSYGGLTVNYLLSRHPARFAAGVSENPVTDYLAEYGGADGGTTIGTWAAGVEPWEDAERMRALSPAAQAHRIRAPLLLLQCEADLRCPPVNSEIPFAILRSLGRTVELVRYPEEFHLLFAVGRPDRRVDRIERIVDWFRRYL
ncbi:MAG: alpha/beta fold hydrolase [Gaiellaceae bacterium]